MIRIAVVGKIGSGKSYVASLFKYPIFNADKEVADIYKKNKNFYTKLKKKIPKFITIYPINKREIIKAILQDKNNLKKITNIIHPIIRKKLSQFISKNKNKKAILIDVPLYLENKLNKKNDIIIYIDAKDRDINKRLKKRANFSQKLINRFKKIQLKSNLKKKKSDYTLKNNFNSNILKKEVKKIKKKIFKNDN